MILINGKKLIFDHSFVVPDGEDVTFHIPEPIGVQARIIFDLNSSENNSDIEWEFKNQILQLTFKGWRNSLGTALKKAAKLGDLKTGESFGFNIVHFHVGQVNFLTMNVFLGGDY